MGDAHTLHTHSSFVTLDAPGAGERSQSALAKMKAMGSHLFDISHEGWEPEDEPYYISEKLWEPFRAGTVPVYFGASIQVKLEEILPEHSWIDASSFDSLQASI